jgi:tetratricopeptide (TPR) repeat protein
MKYSLLCLPIALLGFACAWGQRIGTLSGSPALPTVGTTPTGAAGAPNNAPAPSASVPGSGSGQRPIFISGSVTVDDGSPLPGSVDIQASCGGKQRILGHSSSEGDFVVQLNDAEPVSQDTSESGRFSGGGMGSRANGLLDCEVRASASGFISSRASLSDRSGSDFFFNVGTLVLHRQTGEEGTLVSVVALRAPKDAVKNFEKGEQQVKAKKCPDAAASFRKALAIYPQYADAWLSLGKVESQLGGTNEARTDFQKAMDLDPKMVGPWQQLGYMASDESKWAEAAKYLDQAVRLDPMDSPMAWYFSALANYNLGRFDMAERSVRAEIKLDRGQNPRAEYLLGLVLIARKDLTGGADVLRKYIQTWPHSGDVDSAKKQLSRIEGRMGGAPLESAQQ